MTDDRNELRGFVAEFTDKEELLRAAASVRDEGFTKWDAHTPFPVHGLDDAMGIRPTRLPWLVMGAGVLGAAVALALQWWTNGVDYPFRISGKPMFGLPAAIPVAFELTILFAALTVFVAVIALNGLPRLSNPLFTLSSFRRATQDRFFIAIEADDPKFDTQAVPAMLSGLGATAVEACHDDASRADTPGYVKVGFACVAMLGLVPLALIAKARLTTSQVPRIDIFADMDQQPRLEPQSASSLFEDGRAMRPQVAGTIARGDLRDDPHLWSGKTNGEWAESLPLPVTTDLMARGRRAYRTACAVCHGNAGYGDGLVAKRADKIGVAKWVPPTSLHADHVRTQPDGQIYNTITNGIRNMAGYRDQVKVEDRWAIVLYVRALQRSQRATAEDVPSEHRGDLK